MNALNTFRISLKELAKDNSNYTGDDKKTQFLIMTERALDYKNHYTKPIPNDEESESKFVKNYLVMNETNVVLRYSEYYEIIDEKLRNSNPLIFAKEIAEAEVKLEDIIIDAFSMMPLDNFKEEYMKLIKG